MTESPAAKQSYEATHARVNRWIQILNLTFNKVTQVGVAMPNCVMSFFNYYWNNLGVDAFILPFPMWFVFQKSIFQFLESIECVPFIFQKVAISLEITARLHNPIRSSILINTLHHRNFMYDTSLCETLITIAANIERMVHSLNDSIRTKGKIKNLHEKLIKGIASHAKGIQLSNSNILNIILFLI